MPLGELRYRTLSDQEMTWRQRWVKMRFPRDLKVLRRMPREEYRAFIYALDPRVALLMANDSGHRAVLDYQRNKKWYHEWRDSVCRLLNL